MVKYYNKKGVTVRVSKAKKAVEYDRKGFVEVGDPAANVEAKPRKTKAAAESN